MKKIFSLASLIVLVLFAFSCSSSNKLVLKVEEHKTISQPLAPPVDYKEIVNVDDVGYKAELVAYRGRLYIGNLYGEVYEIDPTKEEKKLIIEFEGQPIEASVAISNNFLFVGTTKGWLYKVNLGTRKIVAKRHFGFPITGNIYVKDDYVYFADENDKVYCLNEGNLSTLWSYVHGEYNMFDIRGFSGIFFSSDGILLGFDDGSVDKISYSGDQIWSAQVSKGSMFIDSDTTPVQNGNIAYVTSTRGYTEALNIKDGSLIWKRDISSYSNMQLNIYGLYIADDKGRVYCLDNSAGETIWKKRLTLKGDVYSIKLIGDVLFALTSKGKLICLDALTGKIMDMKDLDDDFSSFMTYYKGKLYTVSRDGEVYQIYSK